MSSTDSIHISLISRKNAKHTALRNVRLQIPADKSSNHMSQIGNHTNEQMNNSPPMAFPDNDIVDNFSMNTHSFQLTKDPKDMIILSSPSIEYRFDENAEPLFIYDVLLPNSAISFDGQPPINFANPFSNPRLLIYSFCKNPALMSTQCVSLNINNNKILKRPCDPRPIDITDRLAPFGQQNWISIETPCNSCPTNFNNNPYQSNIPSLSGMQINNMYGNQNNMNNMLADISYNAPMNIVIVGVWANYLLWKDIVDEISKRPKLNCDLKSNINNQGESKIFAKGISCIHSEFFDLEEYICFSQASNSWICPICYKSVPYDEIRLGEMRSDECFCLDETSSPVMNCLEDSEDIRILMNW
ncbi:hypothetical protein TRFO_14886 [Tritrichomonas foetus]|uniref:Uncharacterized protein n=1 Tax=Tritrichomonas foetus TaxID=1144522 RepID=A0A1J4KYQ1_9EUKA|nr:hypothetical protein TRFO_14886 [Tritrichomonas foetus]|eukprot:OHT14701.1 hypothetical protein TRFO_14886 [Tritrichomonas foetus]